ncbi:unnamed protein product [Paramecium sonneborni]|uniref:Uncharacterized protein n=1 Tax=Paramecium sonneborni TaxID=65129 RepID=A0A8S1RTB8_9CILI|nr:unnamed protein product [Paramecium sonneborni]
MQLIFQAKIYALEIINTQNYKKGGTGALSKPNFQLDFFLILFQNFIFSSPNPQEYTVIHFDMKNKSLSQDLQVQNFDTQYFNRRIYVKNIFSNFADQTRINLIIAHSIQIIEEHLLNINNYFQLFISCIKQQLVLLKNSIHVKFMRYLQSFLNAIYLQIKSKNKINQQSCRLNKIMQKILPQSKTKKQFYALKRTKKEENVEQLMENRLMRIFQKYWMGNR